MGLIKKQSSQTPALVGAINLGPGATVFRQAYFSLADASADGVKGARFYTQP